MATIITEGSNIIVFTVKQFPDGHYLVVATGLEEGGTTERIVHSIEDAGKVMHQKMLDAFFKPLKESVN